MKRRQDGSRGRLCVEDWNRLCEGSPLQTTLSDSDYVHSNDSKVSDKKVRQQEQFYSVQHERVRETRERRDVDIEAEDGAVAGEKGESRGMRGSTDAITP